MAPYFTDDEVTEVIAAVGAFFGEPDHGVI